MPEELAINGGIPAVSTTPPNWPIHDEREEELLLEVLRSGQWSELSGGKVQEFSESFAAFQGASHGVSVPSGTLALEAALQALGIGAGDEVITTSYTFIATATAILSVGAKPVFVDIDPESNSIHPHQIELAITGKTRAIVPVHVGGNPCDLDAITEIGARHSIPILEDACQAPGSAWKGRPVGSIGLCGAFSFQESKNLTGGEGGIVITNDQQVYERVWAIHNCGRHPDGGLFDHGSLGTNFRMTEWQAAILLAQLERLPSHIARRQHSADILTAGLEEISGLTPVKVDSRTTAHAWHLYQFRYDAARFGNRTLTEFLTAMQAEGVACSSGYEPLNYHRAMRDAIGARFGDDSVTLVPHTEAAARTTVWIPQTVLLGEDETMKQVVHAAAKIHRAWS
ncbi:MAG: DegT/DnrJ/EryC1/StrS family aminotransferase [Thermomicrobiales bacterium]|nr:DegT/DnrJ/EryC1/StrS family aminotransferase [Thermomicrobiales bacterium]